MTTRLAAAEAAVAALVDEAAVGALGRHGHDDLSALLRRVRGLQARLEFVALSAVREVDVRGSHVDDGALSTAAWVRLQARMAPGEAAAAVRTSRVLGSGRLPRTVAALASGQIDPAHVRAIAAGTDEAPGGAVALIEDEALAVARAADPRHVAALMRRFAHALDPDGADASALARHDRRGLTLSALPDGSVHVRGLADEVTGALLMTAIDAAGPPVPGDRRTAAQRRLDSLADIARRFLATRGAPTTGGGHAHLIVTVDAGTLAGTGGDDDSGPGGTLARVGPVAGSTARRVGCDADVTTVAVDGTGGAEVVARERRFFSWAQRKAMIARDGDRCAVPFCDRPVSWADGHHLDAWARGGPTSTRNGALPCAAHHTMLHEGGWSLHRLPDGRYLVRSRDGRTIGPEPCAPGRNRPPPGPLG